MNLRQFLKPNKKKIIVFFIIILLEFLALIFYSFMYTAPPDFNRECCTTSFSNLPKEIAEMCISQGFTEEICVSYKEEVAIGNLIIKIILIINLIVVYLLSCLINWIYDKVRKK